MRHHVWLPVQLVVYVVSAVVVGEQWITAFVDRSHQGESRNYSTSNCTGDLEDFDNRISSINSHGNCIQLYKQRNCEGPFITIKPGTPSHENVGNYPGFGGRVRSLGPCYHACHEALIVANISQKVTTVILYDHDNFKGKSATLNVSGCIYFPIWMKNYMTSIRIQDCVEIHEFWNCTGASVKLRPQDPSLNYLGGWGFNDRAQSISLCGINCNRTRELGPKVATPPPGKEYVTLFGQIDYNGPFIHVDIMKEKCANLNFEWSGEAQSIKTYGNCVEIFSRPNCRKDKKNLQLSESIANLMEKDNFEREIRSVASCDYELKTQKPSGPNMVTKIILGLLGAFTVIILLTLVLLIRNRRKHKRIVDMLSEQEISQFLLGVDNVNYSENDENSYMLLPYNTNLEIPKENIKIDMKNPLGSGEYAVVYPGEIVLIDNSLTVAVKTVKPFSGAAYIRTILKEIKTMSYVGNHKHIVQLVGCYTKNLKNSEIYLMTEFCENGSLQKFLQRHKESFVNFVAYGHISDDLIAEESKLLPRKLQHSKLSNSSKNFEFNTFNLFVWAYQISLGMQYLSEKKVIHGDLAARNILLDHNLQAKICDFGLSRRLYTYTQYIKKQQAPLPWRWLPLESLTQLEFSTASDCWSYGVTLYEIFTLGGTPFPGLVYGEEYLNSLKDGLRLTKPQFTTIDCYNLMLECWKESPEDRISFPSLSIQLRRFLELYKKYDHFPKSI